MSTKCRNSSAFVPLTTLIQFHEATVFLKELRVSQLVQKFPEFYEAGRFITIFTTAPHFLPPRARKMQSISQSPLFQIHFNIILPYMPRSSTWPFSFRFLAKNPVRSTCPAHLPWFFTLKENKKYLGHKMYVPFFSNIFPWNVYSFRYWCLYANVCTLAYKHQYLNITLHIHQS